MVCKTRKLHCLLMTPQFNCSATSAADLQLHLNEDLKIVSKWMEQTS